eukprot:g12356.t1
MAANLSSISGAWVLDQSRSDTMAGHLRCMLVPDQVISSYVLAEQQACQSRNVIAVIGQEVIIHQRTVVDTITEIYHLDTEGVIETDFGERRSMVSFSDAGRSVGLVITTTRPTAESELHLVEVRQLVNGGMEHTQVLHLTNLTTERQHVTRRTWVRVPMTADDRQRLCV